MEYDVGGRTNKAHLSILQRRRVHVCASAFALKGVRKLAREFAKEFYHSREWQKVRDYVLARDHYKCTRCPMPAEEVHHIIRLSPENINDVKITLNPENLISLCKDCHFAEHKREKEAGRRKANGTSYGDCREGFHFDENGMLVPDEVPQNF